MRAVHPGRDDAPVGLPVRHGRFDASHAERLLWRAGFGPRRGEAASLAKLGLDGAVEKLLSPGPEKLVGRPPHDSKGRPLAPADAWGHDHTWWLDRMVRTSRPLTERMTLVWHDWFATSNDGVGSQKLMLRQNDLFRRHAVGSFERLLLDVTRDPAMLKWLNGTENRKGAPNENYAREMMELFTLGADRGAYSERDVREQARSLTGWQNDWKRSLGDYNFHFDPKYHDDGVKTVFHKSGRYDWQNACKLCISHPAHASFFVRKLWSYFVPVPPDAATEKGLEALYRADHQVKPVLARSSSIRCSTTASHGEAAGRAPRGPAAADRRDRCDHRLGVDRPALGPAALLPTERRGLGRLALARHRDVPGPLDRGAADPPGSRPRPRKPPEGEPADAAGVLTKALKFWHNPELSDSTHRALLHFAQVALADAGRQQWKRQQYPVLIENALRQLIAVSPDLQTA